MDAAARIRALVADTPGLHLCLAAILDRRDRTGQLPDRLTVAASPACADALVVLFSARAVLPAGAGKVRLDLAAADALARDQHGAPLDALLYSALGRDPADPRGEEQALRARLAAGLAAFPAATPVARAYLDDARAALTAGRGPILVDARAAGADAALARAADVVRGIDAVMANSAPVRRATFAARVFGDSKALQPGRDLPRSIGMALVELDPAIRDDVLARLGDGSDDLAARLALESRGIFRDEASVEPSSA